jgi:hypothetical protein
MNIAKDSIKHGSYLVNAYSAIKRPHPLAKQYCAQRKAGREESQRNTPESAIRISDQMANSL